MRGGEHPSTDGLTFAALERSDYRVMFTPARPDRRRQYAALPWRAPADGVQVLLVTSRETRRWIIPKGWPMRGRTGREAAAQEAWEEAGVRGRIAEEAIGVFHYGKRLLDGRVQPCAVKVFPLEVDQVEDVWPEQAERERRWMSASDAVRAVEEPELKILMAVFASQPG